MFIRFSFSFPRLFRRSRRAAKASASSAARRTSSERHSFALEPPQAASTHASRKSSRFTAAPIAPAMPPPASAPSTPLLSPMVFSAQSPTTPPVPKFITESDSTPLPSPYEPLLSTPPPTPASPSDVTPTIDQINNAPGPLPPPPKPTLTPSHANTRHVSFQTPVLPESEAFQGSPRSTCSTLVVNEEIPVGNDADAGTGIGLAVSTPERPRHLDPPSPLHAPSSPTASVLTSGRARTVSLFAFQPVRVDATRFTLPAPPSALKMTHGYKRKSKRRSLSPLPPLPPLPAGATMREKRKSRWSHVMEKPETQEVLLAMRGF